MVNDPRTKMNISLTVDEKIQLQALATAEGLTASALISQWIAEAGASKESALAFMTERNVLSETFELLELARRFKVALKNNMVMSFSEYVERYICEDENGCLYEDVSEWKVRPFVYIDEAYANEPLQIGSIMVDVGARWVNNEDMTIHFDEPGPLWSDEMDWGYPRLYVKDMADKELPEGTVYMRLDYVNRRNVNQDWNEDGTPMTAAVYLNKNTGKYVAADAIEVPWLINDDEII